MNKLLIPDFFAMAFLLVVLTLVRRRYQRDAMRPWMAGLLLILLECAAHILYGINLPTVWHRIMHVVALDAYLVAGVFFLRSSSDEFRQMPNGSAYLAVNVLPHLLLLTIYGMEVQAVQIYLTIVVAGCIVGFISARVLRRPWWDYAALACIWTPLMIATSSNSFRIAIYISLAGMYMLVAIAFFGSLHKGSLGKLTIVTGFVIWSLCFLTHPWIAVSHPGWATTAGAIWSLQKFLITVGFMVALFEKQLEDNEWLALHDELTGLANRRLFDDRLSTGLARAERDRSLLLLFNLDLDGFKVVNDTLGHDVGDILLKRVSANLHTAIRKTDTLARLGGDEFALLATDIRTTDQQSTRKWPGPVHERPETTSCDLLRADANTLLRNYYPAELQPILGQAERICGILKHAASQPIEVQTSEGLRQLKVTVSIGLAIYPTDATEAGELAHIADRRMYEDKRAASRAANTHGEWSVATRPHTGIERASAAPFGTLTSMERP